MTHSPRIRARSAPTPERRTPGRARRAALGAATGLITAAVALGVSMLVAGVTGPAGAPVDAVGSAVIDLAPPAVKDFAISAFGSNDKTALIFGILVLLAAFAALIGAAALRRAGYGLAGLAVFAAIGLAAALTRPGAGFLAALPTVAGAATAAFVLTRLALAACPPAEGRQAGAGAVERPSSDGAAERRGGQAPAAGAAAQPEPGAPAETAPRAETEVPAETASQAESAGPADPGGAWTPAGPGPAGGPRTAAEPGPGAAWGTPAGVARAGLPRPGAAAGSRQYPEAPGMTTGRRRFLITGGAALAAAGLSAAGGRVLSGPSARVSQARSALRFPAPAHTAPPLPPGADLRIPGLSPFITPNGSFYRVDTALLLPQVPPENWVLRVHGMVERPLALTYRDLLRLPLTEHYATLSCVSNPVSGPYIGNALWLGASLADVLRAAGIRSGADQLLCTSADGFTSGTPVQVVMDGRDALLAVAMNRAPLPVAHGFPVRMVVPGLYGYVSATKWVVDIKATTFAAEQAYWVQRGWSQQAPIKTECRIDVPSGGAPVRRGRVAVAGVAWAPHKGIAAVEVRVDRGPWRQARLAAVPGIDTWRQWVWEWDATPGAHRIEARATDATGYTQTAAEAPPPPNGATGYPAAMVSVR